jgi:hypothetical protein
MHITHVTPPKCDTSHSSPTSHTPSPTSHTPHRYTQYIPLSMYELQGWLGTPCIYVLDCSAAGLIINNFKALLETRQQQLLLQAQQEVRRGVAGLLLFVCTQCVWRRWGALQAQQGVRFGLVRACERACVCACLCVCVCVLGGGGAAGLQPTLRVCRGDMPCRGLCCSRSARSPLRAAATAGRGQGSSSRAQRRAARRRAAAARPDARDHCPGGLRRQRAAATGGVYRSLAVVGAIGGLCLPHCRACLSAYGAWRALLRVCVCAARRPRPPPPPPKRNTPTPCTCACHPFITHTEP